MEPRRRAGWPPRRLQVARGERLFLKGPEREREEHAAEPAGRGTLAQRGTVSVLGQDLGVLTGSARDRFRADHVGYIFQLFNLVPYPSVLDNVLLPPALLAGAARACAGARRPARRGGPPDLPARPGGELLDRAATELSVGQQQGAAARARSAARSW
ncbi:MAG: hypothetical protein IPK65_06680 [Gammaproteobacteria bacterium]|nr:hypothetical protein [Gammaproteobacteria bacterium]